MSEAARHANPTCRHCGAVYRSGEIACWLCHAPLPRAGDELAPHAAAAPHSAPRPTHVSYSLSTLLLIMTVLAISCALIATLPGLGIIAAILLVPVLVRTSMVVRRARESAGDRVGAIEKITLGATSFAATTLLVSVVGFTAFCCFCSVCALMFGVGSGEGGLLMLSVGAAALAVGAFFLLRKLIRATGARYHRDIQVKNP